MKKILLLLLLISTSLTLQCFASAYGKLIAKSEFNNKSVSRIQQLYTEKFCATLKPSECQHNVENVKTNPVFGKFDLANHPIINNKLGITEVDSYKITYTSPYPLEPHNPVTLSGQIIYPKIDKSKIKGVVLYFHPTIFDPDSILKNEHLDDIISAGLYATQGYIVLLPDYNGLGDDFKNPHPYVLYPRINAQSALYLSIATRNLIDQIYNFKSDEYLHLFTVGYSEGAGYSVWFSRLTQDLSNHEFYEQLTKNHYKLTASVGMDGAYDVSHTVKNFLIEKVDINGTNKYKIENQAMVNMVKPGLVAITLDSYAYMNHLNTKSLFNPNFYDMQCSEPEPFIPCIVDGKQLNLSQALRYASAKNDTEIAMPMVGSAFAKSMKVGDHTESYVEDFFSMLNSTNNSIFALVQSSLITDPTFNNQMKNADIINWDTKLPIHFITLKQDSVVSPLNSDEAIKHTRGSVKNTIVDNSIIKVNTELGVSNVDHLHAPTYLNIIAVDYFNSFVTNK